MPLLRKKKRERGAGACFAGAGCGIIGPMKPRASASAATSAPAPVPAGGPVLYDSTLRDGAQALGITFSPAGKLRLAHLLDDFGIPYLEGGFAGSNERDMQFFRDVAKERLQRIRIAAFGATRRPGTRAEDDEFLRALLRAETPVATIFGKCWKFHVREVRLDEFVTADGCLALKDDAFADEKKGWALVQLIGKNCSTQSIITRCTLYERFTTEEALQTAAQSYGGLR